METKMCLFHFPSLNKYLRTNSNAIKKKEIQNVPMRSNSLYLGHKFGASYRVLSFYCVVIKTLTNTTIFAR